ncbi:MAG: hydroxysqualene dehydroxylase HpnE [Ignavibacteriales bacterium]|nr:hydroxysqualene dehydroxylase HpnE [Ignavibacteriales bacterium]
MGVDTLIIGGGLAGLSAAVDLSSRGISVLVLEQRPHLGGRTYSFVDEKTGDVVDNGQHLMMGCYHATRWLLSMIGSDHLAALQANLHIDFLHPVRGRSSLHCPPLPAPFHLLAGLLRLNNLSVIDRLKLLRVGLEIRKDPQRIEPTIASLTVHQWLDQLGQSDENKKYLWDILAIGSLNDDPKDVSALLFYRVLRSAFLGRRENSSFLVPRTGLTQLFVDPCVDFIRSRGGEVIVNCGVDESLFDGDRLRGVRSSDGRIREAQAFVSAIPWYAASPLFSGAAGRQGWNVNGHLQSSPIVTINLWFDRMVMEQDFVALLDSRIHWVFNKSKIYGSSTASRQYISLVISGAASLILLDSAELVRAALKDLSAALPAVRDAVLVHSLVIKEKRATFSPRPDAETHRPSSATQFRNLFLAGDWTNTGYPATIEGAVLSGRKAAEEVAKILRR